MNAKQITQVIASTCRDLDSLGLLFASNSPCVTESKGSEFVSWPSKGAGSARANEFGTLEQYLDWIRQGEFTCLLFDYSLIQVSFECMGNAVVGHNLLYWPCPLSFQTDVEMLSDLCDGFELCIESPRRARDVVTLTMRTPMRFDFDPQRESELHPLIHLHTQFDETRISVQGAMCFPSFIKKVFRTFYVDKWAEHPEIEDIHEQGVEHEECRYAPVNHGFQLVWP